MSGRHNTIYAIEYYAIRYDDIRVDSENWTIRNCTFDHIDGFINYRYGKLWMHDSRPLKDLTLENVSIRGLSEASVLIPVAGNPMAITMKNVDISWRKGVPAEGMFITTSDVKLVLDNVRIEGFNS